MNQEPFVIEQTYKAPINRVWRAITDRDEMKEWYFDIKEFKPEAGFEFQFEAGDKDLMFMHKCKVTEVEIGKKIAYTWRYEGFEGLSHVTFELFDEDEKTRLKLTHAGLESFPQNNQSFTKESFADGWKEITGVYLKEFVEK